MNRPYSLINVFDNLRGRIKKKPLEKLLDELVHEGHLAGKLYGKAKIYFYNQSLHPQLNVDDMNNIKTKAEEMRTENKEKAARIKELKTDIVRLDRIPSIAALTQDITDLQTRKTELQVQVDKYKGNEIKLVSEAEIKKVELEKDKVQLAMRKREKMLKDIIDMVSESADQKPIKVRAMMGLD